MADCAVGVGCCQDVFGVGVADCSADSPSDCWDSSECDWVAGEFACEGGYFGRDLWSEHAFCFGDEDAVFGRDAAGEGGYWVPPVICVPMAVCTFANS
jgi:hypothetical protein